MCIRKYLAKVTVQRTIVHVHVHCTVLRHRLLSNFMWTTERLSFCCVLNVRSWCSGTLPAAPVAASLLPPPPYCAASNWPALLRSRRLARLAVQPAASPPCCAAGSLSALMRSRQLARLAAQPAASPLCWAAGSWPALLRSQLARLSARDIVNFSF